MTTESRYFDLPLDSLRALGAWAADSAERALPIFESRAPGDARPREAIAGIREFAAGGKRTARLRVLSLAAFAAAREAPDPAAKAAARAAGLAASSAYTHPLRDAAQTKHVVGAAAYAALALELAAGNDAASGDAEIARALAAVPTEVRRVLAEMEARGPGTARVDALMQRLDMECRGA
ncbi:MAG: hypothetical protein KBC36_10760 [Spirochaetia bacterium]|nr:hypothetical protein [Spirochaetia bacterium]